MTTVTCGENGGRKASGEPCNIQVASGARCRHHPRQRRHRAASPAGRNGEGGAKPGVFASVTNKFVLAVVAAIAALFFAPFKNAFNAATFLWSVSDADLARASHVGRDVEATLRSVVGVPDERYVVVSGARGSGKTQAVLAAADGACGVLRVTVANDKTELSPEFMQRMWLPGWATVDGVKPILRRAAWFMSWAPWCAQAVPTLIVEVESGTRGDVVYNLFHEIKILSSDSKVCRVIAVLNDATAVYKLPADSARQLEVFVDDLTEAEAHEMLTKRGVANDTRRTALIKAVGTRASSLVAVVKLQDGAEALRAYVAQREEEAYQELKKLAINETHGVAVRTVFRCIVEATSEPLQVRINDLPSAALQLSVPANLAKLMKERDAHVLLYHPAENAYRFLTVFHERAAARVLSAVPVSVV